ncbi:hypothetical protein Tsubulata_031840 [Turnera subulata]|uniref:Uncharacterized protein n=1 Tax=Turnera subulata TaxID=218843 RepID=A0A9Q0JE94_9ROSI|nr:hypothetical protein Tsubulata_031840 [Turnera subulata]
MTRCACNPLSSLNPCERGVNPFLPSKIHQRSNNGIPRMQVSPQSCILWLRLPGHFNDTNSINVTILKLAGVEVYMWVSINLEHPATLEALAMEPESKNAVIEEDLNRFVKSKDFYKRVGRARKRGGEATTARGREIGLHGGDSGLVPSIGARAEVARRRRLSWLLVLKRSVMVAPGASRFAAVGGTETRHRLGVGWLWRRTGEEEREATIDEERKSGPGNGGASGEQRRGAGRGWR